MDAELKRGAVSQRRKDLIRGDMAGDTDPLAAPTHTLPGIGPAIDVEDGPKGFGAHSDQERIIESELYRFVRFYWDVVTDIARAR